MNKFKDLSQEEREDMINKYFSRKITGEMMMSKKERAKFENATENFTNLPKEDRMYMIDLYFSGKMENYVGKANFVRATELNENLKIDFNLRRLQEQAKDLDKVYAVLDLQYERGFGNYITMMTKEHADEFLSLRAERGWEDDGIIWEGTKTDIIMDAGKKKFEENYQKYNSEEEGKEIHNIVSLKDLAIKERFVNAVDIKMMEQIDIRYHEHQEKEINNLKAELKTAIKDVFAISREGVYDRENDSRYSKQNLTGALLEKVQISNGAHVEGIGFFKQPSYPKEPMIKTDKGSILIENMHNAKDLNDVLGAVKKSFYNIHGNVLSTFGRHGFKVGETFQMNDESYNVLKVGKLSSLLRPFGAEGIQVADSSGKKHTMFLGSLWDTKIYAQPYSVRHYNWMMGKDRELTKKINDINESSKKEHPQSVNIMTNSKIVIDKITTKAVHLKNQLGESLNMKAAYDKYRLPEGAKMGENTTFRVEKDNAQRKFFISGEVNGNSLDRKQLSYKDGAAFLKKSASEEQLGAKYFSKEVSNIIKSTNTMAIKQEHSATLHLS